MRSLRKAIADGWLLLDLKASDMESVLHHALNLVVSRGLLPDEKREHFERLLIEREKSTPSAIGHAVSIPHMYDEAFTEQVVVIIRLADPLNLGAPDGIATRYIFLLLGPTDQTAQHLDALSSIARMMSDNVFHFEATYAKNQQDVLDAIERHINRNILGSFTRN